MSEQKRLRHFFETELKKGFPEVPVADGIDMEQLVADDDDPVFLTLQIFEDGRVAEDGLRYTTQFNEMLANTIQQRRVFGNMGHISPAERGFAFDVPAVIWLGAQRDENGTWWGKAYVTDSGVKKFLKQLKAANGVIATSIDLQYDVSGLQILNDGTITIDPAKSQLMQLDLAPSERAALQMDRQMLLTQHMIPVEDVNMDIQTVLATLTPDQVPDNVKQEIVSHIQGQLNETTATLQQMQVALNAANTRLFELELREALTHIVPADDKNDTLRKYAFLNVINQMAGQNDIEKAKEVADAFVTSEEFQALAKSVVLQMSGGAAVVTPNDDGASKLSAGQRAEKNIDDIRARWNLAQ